MRTVKFAGPWEEAEIDLTGAVKIDGEHHGGSGKIGADRDDGRGNIDAEESVESVTLAQNEMTKFVPTKKRRTCKN